MDLTEAFLEGYNAQDPQIDNPHLWSSPNWLAYIAGAQFAKLGTSTPIKCKASLAPIRYLLQILQVGEQQACEP